MPSSTSLSLYTPTFSSPSIVTKTSNISHRSLSSQTFTPRKLRHETSVSCKASSSSSSSSSSPIMDFDLYDLMGIESSCSQSQIKLAYRSLQKRCHPDIAGPPGHDMSIILNEAYDVLSDPNSRLAYDKEQAKLSELRGYTGRPLYSVWLGAEGEQRAVFVEETKCVGCLKCALFAEKTFAIESVYGRARVVAQWADPEHKIQEAIEACPVDCISIVERSDLAALEFLMSKQPRGNVRVGAGNSVGPRVSDVFIDVKKFHNRVREAKEKAAAQKSETDLQREARLSAINTIRSISNWIYWKSPASENLDLTRSTQKSTDPRIRKLLAAATARKQAAAGSGATSRSASIRSHQDEYWIPSANVLPPANNAVASISVNPPITRVREAKANTNDNLRNSKSDPVRWGVPAFVALIAATVVRSQFGGGVAGRVEEHVGGTLALGIVNSPWLQFILVGITWFYIGVGFMDLVEAIMNNTKGNR